MRPTTGAIALTRILSGASSAAIDCVSVSIADLVALYHVMPGLGRSAPTEAMLMTLPPPRGADHGQRMHGHVIQALDVHRQQAIELRFGDLADARRLLRERRIVDEDR